MFENNKSEKRFLNIIIVGGGNVGATITEQLSREGHHITVIDRDPAIVKHISATYDVLGIVGNGSSYKVQIEAGIEAADLLIAVTASDELNLLCCTMAKKVGNCASIARVRTPDYSDELGYIRQKLGLSMIINPELEAAREIARLLRLPGALSINSFARSHAELVKFRLTADSPLVGHSIMQLSELLTNVLICAVERESELHIPNGSFGFAEGDIVSFIAAPKNAQRFFKKINIETAAASDAMIVGGGKIAFYLAKQLLDAGIHVRILEKDAARCAELAEKLDGALIFCGDGTDERFLAESGFMQADAFVPLTNIDEENILLTLYAKSKTDAKVITKINRTNFHEVIAGLEMDSVVYPRYITTESIITYARARQNSLGSNIETLYHLFDNRAEAIEFRVAPDNAVVGRPIMQLPLKRDLLLACVYRDGKVFIPSGHDELRGGDAVVVMTQHSGFRDIDDILV